MPAAQPRALGRSDIEPVPDQYAGLPVHMTKMLQRHRHFGKLRYPEQLVVRCQLRYLPDVLAELRREWPKWDKLFRVSEKSFSRSATLDIFVMWTGKPHTGRVPAGDVAAAESPRLRRSRSLIRIMLHFRRSPLPNTGTWVLASGSRGLPESRSVDATSPTASVSAQASGGVPTRGRTRHDVCGA